MERQAEKSDRGFGVRAALLAIVPILAAGCATEHPAYIVGSDRSGSSYSDQRSYLTITVREGDSLSKIAVRYATTVASLSRLNDLNETRPIYPGQVLRVPAPPHNTVASVPLPQPRPRPAFEAPHDPPTPRPRPDHSSANVTPERTAAANGDGRSWWSWWPKANGEAADDAGTAKFIWPVQGRIIEGFGRGSHGERNDGINIATEEGAPIRAAASGTVTYTGNELKDYGNLVLIRHDDGYVTAYAHAASIRVARGDRVEKGEIIATAGETGDVDRPQLHFEIRYGVQAVDPERYLVADRAS